MERAEYLRLAALEGTFWWYRALHAILVDQLNKAKIDARSQVLDAGCGTGGLLLYLKTCRPDLILHGVEINPEAARIAAGKSVASVTISSVNDLPYPDVHFDAVISADVLCHAAVEQARALAELHRCLKPGGMLLLNLPAYHWMLSAHDRHVHNIRRYTVTEARELATTFGFRVIKSFYWNSLLFPLMLLWRLIFSRKQVSSDVGTFPDLLDSLFFGVTSAERTLLRYGFGLPFGGSVLLEARKL
jgi:SAM-dependent methyltransferase